MLIKVYGSKSPRLKALIRDAVEYAGQRLMSKRMHETLEISIKMKDGLDENVAEVEWIDDPVRPKSFEMSIDRNQSEMLQVICVMHEMVHIKQYATGDLVQSMRDCQKSKWKKTEWIDDSKVKYYDLPWEIEAHGREKGMTLEWLSKTDLLTEEEKVQWKEMFLFRR
jgi:hypothetical protein